MMNGYTSISAVVRTSTEALRAWLRRRLRVVPLLVACGMLGLGLTPGCNSLDGGPGPGDDEKAVGSGSARVTYASNVHVLEEEEGTAAIAGISTNGAALLMEASNPDVAALQPDDILVIKGLLAKRIVAVEPEPPYLLVLTQPADLTDAISDGSITVSNTVRFGDVSTSDKTFRTAQSPDGEILNGAENAGKKDAFGNVLNGIKGAIVDGWTVDWSATPSQGRVDLNLRLTRSVAGMTALITGEGYLTGFDFQGDIVVEQSTYQKVEANLKSINGLMNFNWEVGTDTPGTHTDKAKIKLPGAIEIPLAQYLEGLPLFLEISAALIVEPALTGGQEYSRGSFRITYDGYQHFSAKEGNIDSDGNVTGDIELLEGQNISALAPLGMVVAFAAPRIELTLGMSKAIKASKDIKEAASKVDALADKLAKKVLTPEEYDLFKNSPAGQFSFGKAVKASLASDAAAFFEMVTSCGMSHTGLSVIEPCTRHDISLSGKVGFSAEAFGQPLAEENQEIFSTDLSYVDPPGSGLCDGLGDES